MQQLATGVFSRGADLSVFGVVILIFIPSFHMFLSLCFLIIMLYHFLFCRPAYLCIKIGPESVSNSKDHIPWHFSLIY